MEMNQELTQEKIQTLQRAPIVETHVGVSQDGKWIIHRTSITDIKPFSYFEKVMETGKTRLN